MVKPPPHMDFSDPNYPNNQDGGGFFPTIENARRYEAGVKSLDYHTDRFRALSALIQKIDNPIHSILDFGVGDGGTLRALNLKPTEIIGIDISDSMIRLAEESLVDYSFKGKIGGVEQLSSVSDGSIDVVLCLNTLGYLTHDDQDLFFTESSRVLRRDGHLLVMTGNELFDLFALNSGTVKFFEKHFNQKNVSDLLTQGDSARFMNADRRNPLSFAAEMEAYDLVEISQSFSSWHKDIPAAANLRHGGNLLDARSQSRDHFFNSNLLPKGDAWKQFFCCSIFASILRKI
jgi:ubiquinone/menaquinone biosynthesis C-methylase UbiE